MSDGVDGLTVTITGGAGEIGRRMAARFAHEGAAVVIADINGEAAQTAARELTAAGLRAIGVWCDVTDEASVGELIAAAVQAFGRLDVHVNNAGFARDAVMHRMTLADFQAVLEIHLVGTWLGTRAASATMREQGIHGSIINMSSISGKVGNPGQTNYSAAKAGIIGLTKAAAKECARYGVRVNAIQPGLLDTAMVAAMRPDVLADRIAGVPLGRLGTTDDVSDAALFLASARSSYMTGNVLEVAGGRHM